MEVIPWYYYYFFGGLEPILEVVGAYLCIFTPESYVKGLLPPKVERTTTTLGGTLRGRIVCGALGSYFFTFSLIAFGFFPLVTRLLGDRPHAVERLTRGYLAILAICDIQHIVVTLLPMPMSLLRNPSQWTVEIHGNISITIALFIVRSLWFIGVGRCKPTQPTKAAVKAAEVEGRATPSSPAGIPTAWYYLFGVIEPLAMIAGALYILVLPGDYGKALLPDRYERVTSLVGNSIRGQIVLGGLGSCLILTSLVQLTMFPLIRSQLADDPESAKKMINGLLAPLAVCDLLHAATAFWPLPASLSDSVAKWTPLMQLNIIGKLVFLVLRVLYFMGGETDTPKIPSASIKKARRKVVSTGQEAKEAVAATANDAKGELKKRNKKVVD